MIFAVVLPGYVHARRVQFRTATRITSSRTVEAKPRVAVPIRDDAPALSVVLLTAANARPTRRAQAIAQLCREHLSILTE